MAQTIVSAKNVNKIVSRVTTSHGYTMDIYTLAFACKVGDSIRVNITDKPVLSSDYVMSGRAYYTDATHTCISSGGLLSCLPMVLPTYSSVYVNIDQTRRRPLPLSEGGQNKTKTKK